MKLGLNRTYHPEGTNGELLLNGEKVRSTIELPWKENKTQVSCNPERRYELQKRYTPRSGKHFILMNVPNQRFILLHAANDALKEIKGGYRPGFITYRGRKRHPIMNGFRKPVQLVYPGIEKVNLFF